jgi:hypothetical protein
MRYDLKISCVILQVFIVVDEKGTEAAAATIAEVTERLSAVPSGPLRITPLAFFLKFLRNQFSILKSSNPNLKSHIPSIPHHLFIMISKSIGKKQNILPTFAP